MVIVSRAVDDILDGATRAGAEDWESLARSLAAAVTTARCHMSAAVVYESLATRAGDPRDAASMREWATETRESAASTLRDASASLNRFVKTNR